MPLQRQRTASFSPLATFPLWLLLVNCSAPPEGQQAEPTAPNIVYILLDDLGYGDLGAYGQEIIQTPYIDSLAKQGMLFTQHYSGSPVCAPSRCVLMSGRHSGHAIVRDNWEAGGWGPDETEGQLPLPKGTYTLGTMFQDVGHTTSVIGKWGLGGQGTTGEPNEQGFDHWFGYLCQRVAHNHYPTHLWRNDQKYPLAGNVIGDYPNGRGRVSSKRVTYSHDVMTDQLFSFLRSVADKPFLAHVHWTIPHANNEGGRVTGDGMEVPDYGIYKNESWPNVEKGQAAMITRMDADVGRLVALLDELKIAENTLLVFTSDNGPHSEGGHKHEFFDSNGPLRGYKRDLYEGGIRVPTIAWWPEQIAAGSESDEPLAGYDWLPTACELAGAECPENLDGISYLPTLLGKPQRSHDALFWSYGEKVALRMGKWKAVRPGKNKPLELYDLSEDIGEEHNVALERPDQAQRIASVIEASK